MNIALLNSISIPNEKKKKQLNINRHAWSIGRCHYCNMHYALRIYIYTYTEEAKEICMTNRVIDYTNLENNIIIILSNGLTCSKNVYLISHHNPSRLTILSFFICSNYWKKNILFRRVLYVKRYNCEKRHGTIQQFVVVLKFTKSGVNVHQCQDSSRKFIDLIIYLWHEG